MTEETLEKATELKLIIDATREGLSGLGRLQGEVRENKEKRNYDDGLYTLAITEHGDGSGEGACFDRYLGNTSLLRTIIGHVEDQLAGYEKELSEM